MEILRTNRHNTLAFFMSKIKLVLAHLETPLVVQAVMLNDAEILKKTAEWFDVDVFSAIAGGLEYYIKPIAGSFIKPSLLGRDSARIIDVFICFFMSI